VLLHQWRAALGASCGCSIGALGDGLRTVEAITVATFESAFRAMERIGHRFGLLIVEEAHHFGNGIRDEALEMCAAPARLGLTATPSAGDVAERLKVLVGPVVYRLGVSDLAGGFLSSYDIVPVEVELEPAERAAYEAALTLFRRAHRPFAAANPGATWADFVRAASQSDGGRRALAAWRRSKEEPPEPCALHRCRPRMFGGRPAAGCPNRPIQADDRPARGSGGTRFATRAGAVAPRAARSSSRRRDPRCRRRATHRRS